MFNLTKVILLISILFPFTLIADYGSGVVDISCEKEKDLLTIKTYIEWNEEYDSFIDENPTGFKISREKSIFSLSKIKDDINSNCNLQNNTFKLRINSTGHIYISDSDKIIYKYTVTYPNGDSIYGTSSPIDNYSLKIKSDGKVIECFSLKHKEVSCHPYLLNER